MFIVALLFSRAIAPANLPGCWYFDVIWLVGDCWYLPGMSKMNHSDINGPSWRREREYLLKRAEDHRQLAETASEVSAKGIHEQLHRLYRERAGPVAIVNED